MKNVSITKIIATTALMGGLMFGAAASAGDGGKTYGLKSWSQEASKSISSVMGYPSIAMRQGKQGRAAFRVTINRDGDVIDAVQTVRNRSGLLNSASKQAIHRADFPDLPSNFDAEQLTFVLNMNYQLDYFGSGPSRKARQGNVTSRRIAQNDGMGVSLQIIDTKQAD